MERPANQARFIFTAPRRNQLIPDPFQRMLSSLRLVPLSCRPAIEKASELEQAPSDLHHKGWRDNLFKREGQGFVFLRKIVYALRPETIQEISCHPDLRVAPKLADALEMVKEQAMLNDDVVFVTGSLFLVAEALAILVKYP